MIVICRLIVATLVFGWGLGLGIALAPSLAEHVGHSHSDAKPGSRYQCAMHPEIVSDEPGVCPICQMKLQRTDDAPAAAGGSGDEIAFYRHPMRPDVTSPAPNQDEMGMAYIPVRKSEIEGAPQTLVDGRAPFTLSTERRQRIGVRTAKVEERDLTVEIRAVGTVAHDPDLYRAITEHRQALAARRELASSPLAEATSGASALVRASSLRLRQLGLSEAQVADALRSAGDASNLLLPGKAVWVYARIYEHEAGLVKVGQAIEVTLPSAPGRKLAAKIAAIDPVVDPLTRTLRVRALVATPDASLRPESFVDVKIQVPLGRALAVPEEAVLDTGTTRVAFVAGEGGRIEPRRLTLGRTAGDFVEVSSGLQAGEQVVASANFLIDSESRFRAALAGFRAEGSPQPTPAAAPAEARDREQPSS